ncbi:MAG: hypothetical protein RLZZ628_2861 [Bacteroidota bacterium]|jgi:hypothetical protein
MSKRRFFLKAFPLTTQIKERCFEFANYYIKDLKKLSLGGTVSDNLHLNSFLSFRPNSKELSIFAAFVLKTYQNHVLSRFPQ